MKPPSPPDVAQTLVAGPWQHRMVSANGARFHLAEAGEGPLVVLLHGFAQFWWAWREQLPLLAAGGYRAAALDLRGFGASDKPPRGYDPATLTADVAGVIRSLGEERAVIVGQGWGAWIAWTMPQLQPKVTRAIAPIAMGHPLTMYRASSILRSRRACAQFVGYQLPVLPQRRLVRPGHIEHLIDSWWGVGSPEPSAVERYAAAVRLPSVSVTSLNGFRRAGRGLLRRDSRTWRDRLADPIEVPVLMLHGDRDRWIHPSAIRASASRVHARVDLHRIAAAGHLPAEEQPREVANLLLDWLDGLPPETAATHEPAYDPQWVADPQ